MVRPERWWVAGILVSCVWMTASPDAVAEPECNWSDGAVSFELISEPSRPTCARTPACGHVEPVISARPDQFALTYPCPAVEASATQRAEKAQLLELGLDGALIIADRVDRCMRGGAAALFKEFERQVPELVVPPAYARSEPPLLRFGRVDVSGGSLELAIIDRDGDETTLSGRTPSTFEVLCRDKVRRSGGMVIRPNTRAVVFTCGGGSEFATRICPDSRWPGPIEISLARRSARDHLGDSDLQSFFRDLAAPGAQIRDLEQRGTPACTRTVPTTADNHNLVFPGDRTPRGGCVVTPKSLGISPATARQIKVGPASSDTDLAEALRFVDSDRLSRALTRRGKRGWSLKGSDFQRFAAEASKRREDEMQLSELRAEAGVATDILTQAAGLTERLRLALSTRPRPGASPSLQEAMSSLERLARTHATVRVFHSGVCERRRQSLSKAHYEECDDVRDELSRATDWTSDWLDHLKDGRSRPAPPTSQRTVESARDALRDLRQMSDELRLLRQGLERPGATSAAAADLLREAQRRGARDRAVILSADRALQALSPAAGAGRDPRVRPGPASTRPDPRALDREFALAQKLERRLDRIIEHDGASVSQSTLGYVMVGSGGAIVLSSLVLFALAGNARKRQLEAGGRLPGVSAVEAQQTWLQHDRARERLLAGGYTTLAVGLVAGAVGAVLIVTSSPEEPSAVPEMGVSFERRGVTAAARWSF